MRNSNQVLLILAAIAGASSLLLSGCIMGPQEGNAGLENGSVETQSLDKLGTEMNSEQRPSDSRTLPGALYHGKADNAADERDGSASTPNDSKKTDKASSTDKCPQPEEEAVPQETCPARGVEHGSPQPLDPAEPPTDSDRPEAPTDNDSDNDEDE
ncbi:MAG TPA: hypothetical protein EYN66_07080 [Myxococcales bacterium]|nr:hypothetical protein [Myxococcales bacterium]